MDTSVNSQKPTNNKQQTTDNNQPLIAHNQSQQTTNIPQPAIDVFPLVDNQAPIINDQQPDTPTSLGELRGASSNQGGGGLQATTPTGGRASDKLQATTINSQQPIANSQQQDFSNQQLVDSSQGMVTSGQGDSGLQATTPTGGRAGDKLQATGSMQQPTDNQPQVVSSQPIANSDQLQVNDQQPVIDGGGQVTSVSTTGLGDKEREPLGQPENVPLVELREDHELEPEVEGWLEKVQQGQDIKLPEPVVHDGEVLVADSSARVAQDKIVLPMTQTGVVTGLKQTVNSGARWLAEWCKRLVKIFGDRVQYKQSQPVN